MDPQTQQNIDQISDRESVSNRDRTEAPSQTPKLEKEDEKLTTDATLDSKVDNDLPNDNDEKEIQNQGELDSAQNASENSMQNDQQHENNPETQMQSDEDNAIIDKNQALDLLNKMKQESIAKIMQNDDLNSSSDSQSDENKHDIDEIINSDPQKLIMMNGHINSEETKEVEVSAETNQQIPLPTTEKSDLVEPEQSENEEKKETEINQNQEENEESKDIEVNKFNDNKDQPQNIQGEQDAVNQDLEDVQKDEPEEEENDNNQEYEYEDNEDDQEVEDPKAKLRHLFGNGKEDNDKSLNKDSNKSSSSSYIDEIK